jgi:DNA polymerase
MPTPELIKLRTIAEELAQDDPAKPPGRLVFGEGNPHARLALIGEAPGETEEREGRPFVRRAGQLLNRLMAETGIERDQVWITNVVKVRPTVLRDRQRQNRTPSIKEINVWLPLLKEELKIIAPELLLGLGAIAGRALIGRQFQLTRDHGRWFQTPYGPCLATFHPSYLLKRRDDKNIEKQFIADLAAVQKHLNEAAK